MKDKEKWWLAFFLMLPFFGGKILADNLAESDDMNLLYTMMFSGFGVIVGYGLYSLTKDRAAIAKLFALGTIVAVFSLLIVVFSSGH